MQNYNNAFKNKIHLYLLLFNNSFEPMLRAGTVSGFTI